MTTPGDFDPFDVLRRALTPVELQKLLDLAAGEGAAEPLAAPAAVAPDGWPLPDGYSFGEVLGWGGMGLVYRLHHAATGRSVAFKTTRGPADSCPEVQALLRAESQALAAIGHHQHIVPLFGAGVHAGRPYLVLRWCEHGSLSKYLGKDRLSPRDAAVVVATAARAVDNAHRRKYVHRDLKPSNLLLASVSPGSPEPIDGRAVRLQGLDVLVSDFGLARHLDDPGEAGAAYVGTANYMSPEQARGISKVGPEADVYGLGAVLYELVTGVSPYSGESREDTRRLVREGRLVPPRKHPRDAIVPRDLEAVCLKALAREPEHRYASALALAEDLNRFLNNRPTEARPPGLVRRLTMWGQNNPGVGTLFAVVLLFAIAASVGFLRERWATAAAQAAAHATRVEKARRLLDAGALDLAAEAFDQAIADGRDDQTALEVERTRCWYRAADRGQLGTELRRLWGLRDRLRPSTRALLRLYHAEHELTAPEADEGAARQALVEVAEDTALPEPERLYARGLIAPSSPQAATSFRQALMHAPTHHRARASLVMLLLFLGQVEEARGHADVLRRALPDHPVPTFAAVWSELLTRDRPREQAHLPPDVARFGAELSPEQAAELKPFLELSDELIDHLSLLGARFQPGAGMNKWVAVRGSLFKNQAELERIHRRALAPFDFGSVPAARSLANWKLLGEVNDPDQWTASLKWASAFQWIRGVPLLRPVQQLLTRRLIVARLRWAAAQHPDPMLSISEMIITMMDMVWDLFVWKDRFAIRATTARLAEQMYRAANGSSSFPEGPFRYQARAFGIMLDVGYREDVREMNAALAQVGGVGVAANPLGQGPLLALGSLARWDDEALLRIRRRAHQQLLLLALEGRDHPRARAELVPMFCRNPLLRYDPDLAHPLIADWRADEPNNLLSLVLAAELEHRQGNRPRARELATRVLLRDPGNASARQIEAATREGAAAKSR